MGRLGRNPALRLFALGAAALFTHKAVKVAMYPSMISVNDLPKSEAISSMEFDVCVIGAGAQGLCVALEAQTRGLKCLILEAKRVGERGNSVSAPSVMPDELFSAAVRSLKWRAIQPLLTAVQRCRDVETLRRRAGREAMENDAVKVFVPAKGLGVVGSFSLATVASFCAGTFLRGGGTHVGSCRWPCYRDGRWGAEVSASVLTDPRALLCRMAKTFSAAGGTLLEECTFEEMSREADEKGFWTIATSCAKGKSENVRCRYLVDCRGPWMPPHEEWGILGARALHSVHLQLPPSAPNVPIGRVMTSTFGSNVEAVVMKCIRKDHRNCLTVGPFFDEEAISHDPDDKDVIAASVAFAKGKALNILQRIVPGSENMENIQFEIDTAWRRDVSASSDCKLAFLPWAKNDDESRQSATKNVNGTFGTRAWLVVRKNQQFFLLGGSWVDLPQAAEFVVDSIAAEQGTKKVTASVTSRLLLSPIDPHEPPP